MDIKKYKILHESPEHFVVHDGTVRFQVAKKGLDKETVSKIQNLAEGGEVEESELDKQVKKAKDSSNLDEGETGKTYEDNSKPETSIDFEESQKFSEGGKATPTPTPTPSSGAVDMQASMRKAFKFDGGGTVPTPTPVPPTDGAVDMQASMRKAFKFDEGGDVPNARDPQEALQKEQTASNQLKRETSTPYGNYGTVKEFAHGGPVHVNYHFYHGGNVPTQHMDDGGSVPQVTLSPEDLNSETAPVPNLPRTEPLPQAPSELEQAQQSAAALSSLPGMGTGAPPPVAPPAASIPSPAVAPENQVSFKPSGPSAPMPPTPLDEFKAGEASVKSGIEQSAKAQSAQANENLKNINSFVEQEKDRQAHVNEHMQQLENQTQSLYEAARDNKIDPSRLWNSTSTPGKISVALGLIFGGIASGMTGQPNAAAAFIEKAIDRDVEAQKADQSNKMNMYKMGMERYKNEQSASDFARLQAHALLSAQIDASAAKLGTTQALSLAQQAKGELQMKDAPIKQSLGIQDYAMKTLAAPNSATAGSGLVNNQKWNALKIAGIIKPEDENVLNKESQTLHEAEKLRSGLKDSFKKLDTLGAGYFSPGLRDAEMQSLAGVLARVSEGRFNLQESKQQIEAIMPQLKDITNPSIRKERLRKLNQLIDATAQTPTLDRYGLHNKPPEFTPGAPVIK